MHRVGRHDCILIYTFIFQGEEKDGTNSGAIDKEPFTVAFKRCFLEKQKRSEFRRARVLLHLTASLKKKIASSPPVVLFPHTAT